MKLINFFLILLIIPISVSAYVEETKIFNEGESYIINTKNVTVHNIFSDKIRISVDFSDIETLNENETEQIRRVNITLEGIIYISSSEPKYAELTMLVISKNECFYDSDCDDGDSSTDDSCKLNTNICDYEEITSCKDNDGYCPQKCSKYSDSDCEIKCNLDYECEDDDPCTEDSCSGDALNKGDCLNEIVTACGSGDECCPLGCGSTSDILSVKRDLDCSKGNKCIDKSECDDGDDATIDLCVGDGIIVERYCSNTNTVECISKDDYCPLGCDNGVDSDCPFEQTAYQHLLDLPHSDDCDDGEIKTEQGLSYYCKNMKFISKKLGGAQCDQNYECRSERCKSDGICLSEEDIKNAKSKVITAIAFGGFLALITTYLYYLFKIKNKIVE